VDTAIVAILESFPDGFIALDASGRCTHANALAGRLLHRSHEELVGRSRSDLNALPLLHHPALDRAIPEGKGVQFEAYQERFGRWTEVRGRPTADGGYCLYLRDVTDRRHSEEELRRSREELLDFFESATEGLHWVGPDGTILWANRAELELLGYEPEEYLGRSIRDFHVDQALVDNLLTRLAAGAEVRNCEAGLRHKDGSVRHVLIDSSVLWFEGRFIHTRGFMRDITKRKVAEDQLRASEQRFARFMEYLPGLAWMKDPEGRYVYVNASAARAFRRSPEELHGKSDAEIFAPETAAQFQANDRDALESGRGVLVVETLEQDDGFVHHSIVSKFPVLDADGRVTAIGGMAFDITDRVRAEEALRTADRRKDEFLAMLAHELRNPLAPIMTAIEILRRRGPADPILAKQREVIARQIRHMKRLLDDLLDVSRITRGRIELIREPVSLSSVLAAGVETSRPHIDERGHDLHVSVPDAVLLVEADSVRLSQVFTNLLNNAAKFTEPGGSIWLEVSREGESARVAVRDTGIGMAPEAITTAFELFEQGEQMLDRSSGGLGIGLTLVRELVEMHGGSVEATSPGRGLGTEVVVSLPLMRAPTAAEGAAAVERQVPRSANGCSILVVDDNTDQAETLGMLLQLEGHTVFVAFDAQAGLEKARSLRPRIALLDIGLPGMDGYQLARAIRAEPELSSIVLVAVTGYGRVEDRTAGKEAGFDHHLTKPLEVPQLLALLAGLPEAG